MYLRAVVFKAFQNRRKFGGDYFPNASFANLNSSLVLVSIYYRWKCVAALIVLDITAQTQ
jgi:hypothetical protein